MGCKPRACLHDLDFVDEYVDGFVEQDVRCIFPRLFGGTYSGEIALATFNAIFSESGILR